MNFFKLPDDGRVAVFEILRTVFDDRGKPFLLTSSIYPSDRNEFAVVVGEIPTFTVPGPAADVGLGRHHA